MTDQQGIDSWTIYAVDGDSQLPTEVYERARLICAQGDGTVAVANRSGGALAYMRQKYRPGMVITKNRDGLMGTGDVMGMLQEALGPARSARVLLTYVLRSLDCMVDEPQVGDWSQPQAVAAAAWARACLLGGGQNVVRPQFLPPAHNPLGPKVRRDSLAVAEGCAGAPPRGSSCDRARTSRRRWRDSPRP